MNTRITIAAVAVAAASMAYAVVQGQRAERMNQRTSIVLASPHDQHAGHAMADQPRDTLALAAQAAPARNPNLPPDADAAKDQLARSPRHGEWADIRVSDGPALKSFVVYPERSTRAPVVIVIHEIFGLTDW